MDLEMLSEDCLVRREVTDVVDRVTSEMICETSRIWKGRWIFGVWWVGPGVMCGDVDATLSKRVVEELREEIMRWGYKTVKVRAADSVEESAGKKAIWVSVYRQKHVIWT